MCLELYSILEQFLRQPQATGVANTAQDKGKGILGGSPHGFPPKEPLVLSPQSNIG